MLIEIAVAGVAHYCLTAIPSPHMYDAKGMIIERRIKGHDSPEALLRALPRCVPLSQTHFRPRTHSWTGKPLPAGFREILSMGLLQKLPKFSWGQLHIAPTVLEAGSAEEAVARTLGNQELTMHELPQGGDIITLRQLERGQ